MPSVEYGVLCDFMWGDLGVGAWDGKSYQSDADGYFQFEETKQETPIIGDDQLRLWIAVWSPLARVT